MDVLKNMGSVNYPTLITSVIVLAVIFFYKKVIEKQIARKLSFPIPIDLVIVSFFFDILDAILFFSLLRSHCVAFFESGTSY